LEGYGGGRAWNAVKSRAYIEEEDERAMLPMVGVPDTLRRGLRLYRDLFGRIEGFEHISRYVTGLIVSPNKTLRGIYAGQVWEGEKSSRRAMHEAGFEAEWKAEELLSRHRAVIALEHRGRGREVISLDWTLVHHERGPQIYGTTKSYDYVEKRMGRFQTVVTAVIANRELIDGIELQIQEPSVYKEEERYLKATVQANYEQMEQARERILELFHHMQHRLAYKKRTEVVVEMVAQLEEEGRFPQADYAFDNDVPEKSRTRNNATLRTHVCPTLKSPKNSLARIFLSAPHDGTVIAISHTREVLERTERTMTRNRAKGERMTKNTIYHAKQVHLSGLAGISERMATLTRRKCLRTRN
jgi:hypothetical protein